MSDFIFPAIRPETQKLLDFALDSVIVGQTVQYKEMAELTDLPEAEAARLFRTVMKATTRQRGYRWSSVRGVGYQRIGHGEALEQVKPKLDRIHRKAYRERSNLETLETKHFTKDQELKHAARMVQVNIICSATHANAEKRLLKTLSNSEKALADRDMIRAGLGI